MGMRPFARQFVNVGRPFPLFRRDCRYPPHMLDLSVTRLLCVVCGALIWRDELVEMHLCRFAFHCPLLRKGRLAFVITSLCGEGLVSIGCVEAAIRLLGV